MIPRLLGALHGLGVLGPWAVIPIYTVALLFLAPGPLLGLAAGLMFGTFSGFLVFSFSTALSAGLMFLAGRYLTSTRGWVFEKIESSHKVRAVDDAVTQGGWKMVVLLRQTAVLPFSVMNFALGLSKIPFRDYFLATWISMMPGCLMLAHLGSLAGEVAAGGRPPRKAWFEWAFLAVGLAVTIGLGIYATVRVKRIMDSPVEGPDIHILR